MNDLVDVTNPNQDLLEILEQHTDLYATNSHKKGDFINIKGDIIKHNWYIKSGLLKGYDYIEELGREAILNFLWSGSFLSLKFHFQEPSPVNVQVVEDAVVYKITEENLNKMKKLHPKLEDILQRSFVNTMALARQKDILMHYNNATARYKAMVKQYSFFENLTMENKADFMGVDKKTIQTIINGRKPPRKR